MADVLPLRSSVSADSVAGQPHPALVADARRLAVMLCAGLRTVRAWDVAGKLPKPLRIGGRVVWRVDEIRAWIDAGAPDRETWEALRAARK
ncbi:Marine sediment metagenome DNA, contig: S01H1_L03384 OS=marine sediment metagenome GN=S01H1_10196 PE=4 SV=1: Phage_AlpA [Gemmataceae bacterium]|nr:Marine sediment metagenome DNA, contig: S01H1_L03384 OS=marine sediment metagenome GN=S01H1_10196 PE=4 SV=1: Phage_AlpA [Gemmataceae bacterium]VTT98148.1 Marine sediment metagenome DNA, contig: S01H1_L03384 OS=marine sediment metagenome GN=S01H1_10196 PE=4 SV=1: Phage_AlpA [Gemmataceae bacterium]